MMTFEVPGDERLPPPTGSVDENADDAKLGDAVPW
jgi:hypothetical protein